MKTDPIKRALDLRKTLKKDDKVLVVQLSDTLQLRDITKIVDLMPNVATGDYVFRTKINVNGIDPIAAHGYDKELIDIRTMPDKEIEEFVKKQKFDFPLWFKHHKDFEMKRILDYNMCVILQVAGCNFHDGTATGGCWYCYVDDKSNDGISAPRKKWISVNQTIDSILSAKEEINQMYNQHGFDVNIKTLRISGGEPTLVLDYVLDVWREIRKRGLDFVGQLDSNLSTGSLVKRFEKEGIYEKDILEKLAEHPIRILTAIKGVNNENLQSNVQAFTNMEEQLYSIKRFLKAGFDIYPQMYNPDSNTLESYLNRMDNKIENFSLRVHIGPLSLYKTNIERLGYEACRLEKNPEEFIQEKNQEWDTNYNNSIEVIDSYLQKRYGVGYKDTVRSDVELKILK